MKHILILLTVLLLFSTCKKEEKATLYMSGYIYNNCYDRVPMRNSAIRLYRAPDGGNQNGKIVGQDSTDEHGYFKMYFPPAHHNDRMKLQTERGGDIMNNISPATNIEDGEFFGQVYAHVSVSLNVINSYSIGDTLIIGHFTNGGGVVKVPCPLTSGHLYTGTNWTTPGAAGYPATDAVISWSLTPSTASPQSVYRKHFKIDRYCNDTVYVTVNII